MHKNTFPIVAFLALAIASLACQATAGTPTPGFEALETMVAATLQAGGGQTTPLPTFAMPTALPTWTSAPPTSAVVPTPTLVLPAAMRIQFAAGTTQTRIHDSVPAGLSKTFVMSAQQGQVVIAALDSANPGVTLAIYGADGVVLLPANQAAQMWTGTLPSMQDYYFQVIAPNSTETFTLDIIAAVRIQFSGGEIRDTLEGETINGMGVTYSAYGQAGQKMDVILTVPGDNAAMSIWGLSDGQTYARAQNGVRDFSLRLPSTQDYIIVVIPRAGQEVEYSMFIRVR